MSKEEPIDYILYRTKSIEKLLKSFSERQMSEFNDDIHVLLHLSERFETEFIEFNNALHRVIGRYFVTEITIKKKTPIEVSIFRMKEVDLDTYLDLLNDSEKQKSNVKILCQD